MKAPIRLRKRPATGAAPLEEQMRRNSACQSQFAPFLRLATFTALMMLAAACRSLLASGPDVTRATVLVHDVPGEARGCGDLLPEEFRFSTQPWSETDFCNHSVPYEEIRSGGISKEAIQAIDEPFFVSTVEADDWLVETEPVIVVQLNGEVRAYPLQVMLWHEIVNDAVGGRPVVITYCPLCNSALVFDRRLDGQTLDFGTTGNLRQADLIMYDRQTESWWQQFTGEAIVGAMTGKRLDLAASGIVSYGDFRSRFPDGDVLFPIGGEERPYGETPYVNYDSLVNPGTKWLDGEPDPRLPPKMRVLALTLQDVAVAYPYSVLSRVGVINDTRADESLAVFWKSGTRSALYKQRIAESKDVGSAAAFNRVLDGRELTFAASGDGFVDQMTGSTWNIFGAAIDGPLTGRQLEPIPSYEFLWFAWAEFRPDTLLYTP